MKQKKDDTFSFDFADLGWKKEISLLLHSNKNEGGAMSCLLKGNVDLLQNSEKRVKYECMQVFNISN